MKEREAGEWNLARASEPLKALWPLSFLLAAERSEETGN